MHKGGALPIPGSVLRLLFFEDRIADMVDKATDGVVVVMMAGLHGDYQRFERIGLGLQRFYVFVGEFTPKGELDVRVLLFRRRWHR
jgi:hypothetical protein